MCFYTITLYNNTLNKTVEVNRVGASILRLISINKITIDSVKELPFIKVLIQMGFIVNENEQGDIHILDKVKYKYPLTAISLELTNKCNLNCIHCYGSYGSSSKWLYLPYDWIKNNLSEFNELHTLKIAITGGEATLHPDFLNIVKLLLNEGYELTIFTNGYNVDLLKKLLEQTKNFYYTIKVSCDGLPYIHNAIRRNAEAFERVVNFLNILKEYQNIKTYISTVVMSENVGHVRELQNYIKEQFPGFIHTLDLVFPTKNMTTNSFGIKEFENIYTEIPELFRYHAGTNYKNRCTGGVSQCTVSPDGQMKICNSACADIFKFKYNVFQTKLSSAWINCGDNIKHFRKESASKIKTCRKCEYNKQCKNTDCRVLAYLYTGSENNINPLSCFCAKKHFRKGD